MKTCFSEQEMMKTMDAATLTLIVLGIAAFFFATEMIPLAVTAMGAAIALGFLGVLTPAEVFSGLSNSTVVLFAGMFVIGAAMFQTGLAQKIGVEVVKKSGTDEKKLMIALMVITIGLSSVSSNTATVACLIPVVMQICAAARLPVAPQLMALAIAANVGGTITMIGTPPNILMSATLDANGLTPFGFFEFAWIASPCPSLACSTWCSSAAASARTRCQKARWTTNPPKHPKMHGR